MDYNILSLLFQINLNQIKKLCKFFIFLLTYVNLYAIIATVIAREQL